MTREINEAGLTIIKSFERLCQVGYRPTPNDKPTAGWGHTGKEVHLGVRYSLDEVKGWLAADLKWAEEAVTDCVAMPLNDNQFSALVCLVFNIGETNFETSTLLGYLNTGDYSAAADQFDKWDMQKHRYMVGLARRRAAEKKLFQTPIDTETATQTSHVAVDRKA